MSVSADSLELPEAREIITLWPVLRNSGFVLFVLSGAKTKYEGTANPQEKNSWGEQP
ncbi:MAG: hypothetical protein R3355_21750 [Pseudomonas sp.]|uniref:hypothetical protein n=1 Tax=Pseudomonas sp. TaxID=306 RepID=UPI00299D2C41|nr:hypothetical protein [Pseudomonas sp.]MDX1725718.1 hypothetical protein [Pseudomonas sp.]